MYAILSDFRNFAQTLTFLPTTIRIQLTTNLPQTMTIRTKALALTLLTLLFAADITAQTLIVAHRGYWKTKGSAQNSITALKKADKIGCYASEFDVWITRDGVIVVNHDPTYNGVNLEKANYQQEVSPLRLKNGEPLPTLASFLSAARKLNTGLVLEVKSHKDPARTSACVDSVLNIVKCMGLESRMTYISFSYEACKRLKTNAPQGTPCYYLGGNISPERIKADNLDGVDYNGNVLRHKHPEWIDLCHKLGLKVNVWTIDKAEDLDYFITHGADFITTNEPRLLRKRLKALK